MKKKIDLVKQIAKIAGVIFAVCVMLGTAAISVQADENSDSGFVIEDNVLVEYTGTAKKVVIPDGVEVIGRAFLNNETVEEIVIPDSVSLIGSMAFAYTPNLKKLVIGKGVESAFSCIFTATWSLDTIIVDPENPYMYVEDGVLREKEFDSIWWYPSGKKETSYVIPEDVTEVRFNANKYLESVYISKNVQTVDLSNCDNLKTIEVDPENPYFCAVDNVLYSKDMSTLIRYPSGKTDSTFVVPDTVTSLGDGSWHNVFPCTPYLKDIYFQGNCPRNLSMVDSEYPWDDWYEAFEGWSLVNTQNDDKTYRIHYVTGDPQWEELKEAYYIGFGLAHYMNLEFITEQTNSKGNKVTVTTTADGFVIGNVVGGEIADSVTVKSVIKNAAKDTKTVVTVEKTPAGKITSAKATVTRTVTARGNNSNVTLPVTITEQIKEAAGQKDVEITVKAVDKSGKAKYKLIVNAKNLKSGNKLYVYAKNTKSGNYTMVNDKAYIVSKKGTISVSFSQKATYELLTASQAKKINKEILATIVPEETNKNLEKGEKTYFTLGSSCNANNIKKITYSSSNKKVATVSKKGKITAKGKGTAAIKAKITLKNGKQKTVKMTVDVSEPVQEMTDDELWDWLIGYLTQT